VTFDEYQRAAVLTAVYGLSPMIAGTDARSRSLLRMAYCFAGLASEAGEANGKFKKLLRGDPDYNFDNMDAMVDELGDVLWYIAAIAHELGIDLSYVAERNTRKLGSRQERGTLQGSGDER
jgi:NTP pyrophosphatase (non-canonical NTP hydrolase)